MTLSKRTAFLAAAAVVVGLVGMVTIFRPTRAHALTAGDVLTRMSTKELSAYLSGNIDMAAQLAYFNGRQQQSDCIVDWYYHKNGVKQVMQALYKFKDHQVQPVVYALIEKTCGK